MILNCGPHHSSALIFLDLSATSHTISPVYPEVFLPPYFLTCSYQPLAVTPTILVFLYHALAWAPFSLHILNAVLPHLLLSSLKFTIPFNSTASNFIWSRQVPSIFLPLSSPSWDSYCLPQSGYHIDSSISSYPNGTHYFPSLLICIPGVILFLYQCSYMTHKKLHHIRNLGLSFNWLFSFPMQSPPHFWNPSHALIYPSHCFSSSTVISCLDQIDISAPVLIGVIPDLTYQYSLTQCPTLQPFQRTWIALRRTMFLYAFPPVL